MVVLWISLGICRLFLSTQTIPLSITTTFGVPDTSSGTFVEFESLWAEDKPAITNDGSWVARAKIDGFTVTSVFVNHDFSEEDRELIKTALLRGLIPQPKM